jgi:hypothetical protein
VPAVLPGTFASTWYLLIKEFMSAGSPSHGASSGVFGGLGEGAMAMACLTMFWSNLGGLNGKCELTLAIVLESDLNCRQRNSNCHQKFELPPNRTGQVQLL